jgi:hypothetical protein
MEFPGWRDGCRPGLSWRGANGGWRPFHDVTCQPLPIHGWLYNILIIHARFNSSGDSTITDDLADVTMALSASAK